MFDPFQTQRKPGRARAAHSAGLLRDTSPDAAALRPRSKRLLGAVKMLDVLTAGDEGLYGYLSARAGGTAPGSAADPFAANRGMAGPEEELPVPQTPPPPVDTEEFQALKDDLTRQCREAVRSETTLEEKVTYLAPCGLLFHRIHWIDGTGDIIRHYRPADLDTPLLRKADELLHQGFVLVEVRGSFPDAAPGTVLYAVNEAGEVKKVTV